jgi:hypothetical protein
MTADILLSRLDKVRQTGAGKWMALCPAHADKSPSLSIRVLEGERILVHCFSGCEVHAVLEAVGLTFSDLFPEKPLDHLVKRERNPFSAADILRAISFELVIVSIVAADILAGKPINTADHERLALAISRIEAAIHAGGIRNG